MFTITTDDNAVINLNSNGEVVNYGTEYFSEKIQNYSRIEKFNGRVDLFSVTDDKAFQGKLKYIGRTAITYYASYDIEVATLTKAGAAVVGDVTTGAMRVIKDTVGITTKLCFNDAGTLRTAALT